MRAASSTLSLCTTRSCSGIKKLDQASSPSYYEITERAGKLFAMYYEPGHQQDMLVRLDSANDLASKLVIVDPMKLDPSGSTAIQWYEVSPDGSKAAISLAKGGTETGELHFFEVATGKELPDVLPRTTVIGGGSAAWNADGSGVFYTRFPRRRAPACRHKLLRAGLLPQARHARR